MANVRVIVDEHEYSENQFKKDMTRMFDTYRDKEDRNMGNANCCGVNCDACPLYKVSCNMKTTNSFKTIELVYNWAQEHPVITNKDMLKKTFGKDVIHYIEARPYKEEWLDEEYKKPKGESEE